MQAGSEYLVILNDGRLREAYIQRHQTEARSIPHGKTDDSQSASAHIAHLLMAMRHGLMRFTRLSPTASAIPH
jgi:hypothetical protein